MDGATTTELVQRARDGDEAAWSALVNEYRNVVWATTRGFRFDRDTREDVFQLTWLRLLDHLDSIHEPERLAGWLATTARRECLALVRSRTRLQPVATWDHEHDRTAGELDAALIRSESIRAVAAGLNNLDQRCRELLRLLVVEPRLAYDEIAELMDMPIGSIGPTRGRCLERLASQPGIQGVIGPWARSGPGGSIQ